MNRRDPVPFSHPHFPTLIELILPSWPSWALALPPEAWYDSLGCGIWFNSFSFLVPRPRSERNRGLPVELKSIWPAAQDLLKKLRRKFFLTFIPSNLICKELGGKPLNRNSMWYLIKTSKLFSQLGSSVRLRTQDPN